MNTLKTNVKIKSHHRLSACVAGLVLVAASAIQAWGLDTALPPSGNFDLTTWKVTLPDQSEEDVADLVGFESENEFYTDPVTGAMVFRCPNDGATGGSTYPRSELREMLRGTDTSISTKGFGLNNWVFSTAHPGYQDISGGVDGTMTATVAVDHVSTTGESKMIGRVIIGQIHASGDEPCRLYYRKLPGNTKGSIYIAHEPTDATGLDEQWYDMIGSRSNSASDPADGIALGEQFSYEIDVVGNDLNVTIMRPGKPDVTQYVNMSASGHTNDWMYFKAGCYNQNNSGDDGEYAQVSFYALTKTHTVAGQSDLTVASPYGTPAPAVGTASYANGSTINVSMSGSPDVSGTTRHVVTGWTGTGDVAAGAGTNTSFTLNQNSSLTWLWQTQYWLDTEVSGNGAVDVADAWFDSGSGVTITATPAAGNYFVNWSGASSSSDPVLFLSMDEAKSVTANFAVGSNPSPYRLSVSSVFASSYDTNNAAIPENTLDGSLDAASRWSAQGDGEWITYDLGALKNVHELKLAWYKGDERSSNFDVQISVDGTNWVDILTSQSSSGSSLDFENVDLPDTEGRYVRIVGRGNSANDWNSLTEVEIWGVSVVVLPPEITLSAPEFIDGSVRFTVASSISGASYQLEYTETLTPPSWEDMGSAAIGNGDDLILTDPGPLVTNRFYRMYIQP